LRRPRDRRLSTVVACDTAPIVDALLIEVVTAQRLLALEARYDSESDLLVIESASPANWPHGTTIDGLLTLDLNEDRTLVHAELTWPRARWTKGPVELPNRPSSRSTLRLTNLSTDALTENPEVSATTDGTVALIQFGPLDQARLVPLGATVDALCAGDHLVGFAATLFRVSS
jgi:hypothetical protein